MFVTSRHFPQPAHSIFTPDGARCHAFVRSFLHPGQ